MAFDIVLSAIEGGWPKQKRLSQDTFARKSTTSNHRNETPGDSSGYSSNNTVHLTISPADIKQRTDMLQVLYGIVHSYPREASRVLGETATATRLLACVRSSVVPLDIRLVLVSLASRWCVLLRAAGPVAAKHLASIVDSFYWHTGLLPSQSFLLGTPSNIRIQQGWPYPPLEATTSDDTQSFMYIPAPMLKQEQQQSGSGSGSGHSRNRSSAQLRGSKQAAAATAEQVDTWAQELTSLGGMLIDNLVALAIDEDPRTNKVVQDMLGEVNRLNSLIANYISTSLTSQHAQTTRRLKLATDETKRCHWVYRDSVAAFDEWEAYRQQEYATRVTDKRLSMAQGSRNLNGNGGDSAKPESSKIASSRPLSVTCVVPSEPVPAPVPLERISTKARGKMPETTLPTLPQRQQQ
ncbi:hypothetical protein IWW38_000051 [Coemansia aciculifera]|uniref:Uncharacterized protein n=1 Tax=Coemansia aciculifera TaxID=417176 RepID=A0ACC1MBU8_9FUNG|nr:hypothetical protein IWW38_000051 [Coemansia aciculifera]